MEELKVERSIWIDAPRERVWQAITDPDGLARWLLPPVLGASMKRDTNDTLFVSMGGMEIPVATLEAVEAPRHVRSRALPDGLIAITYLLEEENAGTHVTVTMSGFERLPEDAREDRIAPSGAAWEKALANLNAYVTGLSLPFPEGYVAALFGFRRESEKTFAVERSIWIAAPRERVWRPLPIPHNSRCGFHQGPHGNSPRWRSVGDCSFRILKQGMRRMYRSSNVSIRPIALSRSRFRPHPVQPRSQPIYCRKKIMARA